MEALYPLRFEPVYQARIWGGRRLETLLGRRLPPSQKFGDKFGESWEICDYGAEQSIVASGPLAGRTLHELFTARKEELLGRQRPQAPVTTVERFPLLLKYLDAADRLSVQVHPDDRLAALLDPPDLGKTEAWAVLAAEPGSLVYAGLKPGATRDKLALAIERGECEEWLHSFQPEPGDCLLLPAGTVHALGAGLLVAEIQQASDTTFRMFDWNRVDSNGNARQLHVEQALEAINFAQGQIGPVKPEPTDNACRWRLIDCDKFILDRWELAGPETLSDGRCHLITVLEGSLSVEGDPAESPLPRGGTILLPASLGPVQVTPRPNAVLLDACVPC